MEQIYRSDLSKTHPVCICAHQKALTRIWKIIVSLLLLGILYAYKINNFYSMILFHPNKVLNFSAFNYLILLSKCLFIFSIKRILLFHRKSHPHSSMATDSLTSGISKENSRKALNHSLRNSLK